MFSLTYLYNGNNCRFLSFLRVFKSLKRNPAKNQSNIITQEKRYGYALHNIKKGFFDIGVTLFKICSPAAKEGMI